MKKEYWILWILCAALAFCACSGGYEVVLPDSEGTSELSGTPAPSGSYEETENADETASGSPDDTDENSCRAIPLICVYVCGAVARPGVYRLPEGSRVYEALQAAGGLSEEADAKSLNQAQLLEDGQQITVLTAEEVKNGVKTGTGTAGGTSGSGVGGGAGSSGTEAAKVNLNTATKEELMTLPGVGEARAEAIIAYRDENGGFKSAEDIMKIEGIKEKSYAKLQDKICV